MPAKNTVRTYIEEGYYHIYNRGVEKRNIFIDERDYRVFIHFLKRYLTPPNQSEVAPSWRSDLPNEIRLLAYSLMPNHFHFLVKQYTLDAVTKFMRALSNSYVRYFNERYERVGALFQGRFKAILIDSERYLLYLSAYIHRNPIELLREGGPTSLKDYLYSSYRSYLNNRGAKWLFPDEILAYFKSSKRLTPQDFLSYESFVEAEKVDFKEILADLCLE